MGTELDTEVKRLLDQHRGDWPKVCRHAGVSHSWLSKFARDKIHNPGFGTLKRIHAALIALEEADKAFAAKAG